MNKKRYFPCPVCKAKGDFGDGDYVDVGIGVPIQVSAHTQCGYCEGEGLIEIGGTIHTRNKAFKIGCETLKEGEEVSYQEIVNRGMKILFPN